jgi:presequence protease
MPHPAFDLVSTTDLSEYRSEGRLYRHRVTGLEVFHVANDDTENLFAFSFRTIPADSSGVAHILEHSVLCGSERYPLKDAFITASQGSLNTYMNALTFPDRTVYPAASILEADYFNLMGVYADAVFFPRLEREVFMQEGHRLVPLASGGAEIQGVVYSEMQGNYSSPEGILDDRAFRSLFDEGHPYAYDSGGDPAVIPSLGYEAFLAFHRRHYHPSNCQVFLYGNIPSEKSLDFLEREYLSRFGASQAVPPVPLQKPFARPKRIEIPFPGDSESAKTSILLSWICADSADPEATLAMEILVEILLGHDGSPLGRALRESGLGEDLAPQNGLSTETRQTVFSVGLRGIDKKDSDKVQSLIAECLGRLSQEGIPPADLDAALKSVEFSNREIRRGGGPYCLRLMRRCLRGWTHGSTPEACLRYLPAMQSVKKSLVADPRFFEKLIDRALLSNSHRSVVIAYPDPDLGERRAKELSDSLKARLESMGALERAGLDASLEALADFHARKDPPEALASIPYVREKDLPRRIETIARRECAPGRARVVSHPLFTNGISYLELAFGLDGIDPALMPWMPLFARFVTTAGIPGVPYHEMNSRLAASMGGFACVLESSSPVGASFPGMPGLFAIFRLKCLDGSFGESLDLALQLLKSADSSDAERLKDVYSELKNDVQAALVPSGHAFAQSRGASSFSRALSVDEAWRGLGQYDFLMGMAERPDPARMAQAIDEIRRAILEGGGRLASLTCDESAHEASLSLLSDFLSKLPSPSAAASASSPFPLARARDEALRVQTEVGYASIVMKSSTIDSPHYASLSVLSSLLSTNYLWEEIRMKNGAYGAWASQDPLEGIFSFLSYRDPNPLASLRSFRACLEEVVKNGVSPELAEKAVVGTVSNDLRPLTPEEKGLIDLRRVLFGLDDEIRQRKRDALLSVTPASLKKAAAFLLDGWGSSVQTIIAGQKETDQAVRERPSMEFRALSS